MDPKQTNYMHGSYILSVPRTFGARPWLGFRKHQSRKGRRSKALTVDRPRSLCHMQVRECNEEHDDGDGHTASSWTNYRHAHKLLRQKEWMFVMCRKGTSLRSFIAIVAGVDSKRSICWTTRFEKVPAWGLTKGRVSAGRCSLPQDLSLTRLLVLLLFMLSGFGSIASSIHTKACAWAGSRSLRSNSRSPWMQARAKENAKASGLDWCADNWFMDGHVQS